MSKDTKLSIFSILLFGLLLLWYSMIFVEIPAITTEGRAGLISPYGLLELLLLGILTGYFLRWKGTDYAGLIVLGLWSYLQYNANWKYLFEEAPKEKLESYYQHFENTLRFFPESDTYIIPDAYHMVLGILLLTNLIITIIKVIQKFCQKKSKISVG